MADSGDDAKLAHEALRAATERTRIAWSETSESTEPTKRYKRKMRDELRQFGALANAKLVFLMSDVSVPHAVQLSAVKEFFDRTMGKAVEHLEVDAGGTAEAAAIVAELRALRQQPATNQALLTLAEASAQLAKKQDGCATAGSASRWSPFTSPGAPTRTPWRSG